MKNIFVSAALVAMLTPTISMSQSSDAAKKAFEKMKTLVGTWEGTMGEGTESMKASVTYRLTGSGTALVETLGPGSPFEMITMYHMDGDNLVMTHYCGAGNQPSMRLKPAKDANVLFFDFVRGSNMKPTDMHMHQVTHTFQGPDHVKSVWQSYQDGKPGMKAEFDFRRVKS